MLIRFLRQFKIHLTICTNIVIANVQQETKLKNIKTLELTKQQTNRNIVHKKTIGLYNKFK